VLLGLLAGQLGKLGRGGRRHRHVCQGLDRRVLHDLLDAGQVCELLGRLVVADAMAAQPAPVVEPERGEDQVLGAHVGRAQLGGDAVRVREHEPQRRIWSGLGGGVGLSGYVIGRHEPGGDVAALLGGQATGAHQRRTTGVLVVRLLEDGGQQVRWTQRGVLALMGERVRGAHGPACLLAEIPAGHRPSLGRRAQGSGCPPVPVGTMVGPSSTCSF
jgi:hypothetical protein